MLQNAHGWLVYDAADGYGIESPLLEDTEYFVLTAFFGHQQHTFLRFAEHDLVGRHTGFALRYQIKLDLQADAATPTHLAGGASEPRCAHVLDAYDRAGLHGFKAGLEQQFLQKRIANLHVGALGFRLFAELLARHRGAVNAVASGLGANVDTGISFACSLGVEDLVTANQAERESVHQRISRITAFKLHLAADIRDAETVPVRGDATHHSFKHGMVLVQARLIQAGLRCNRPEA